MAHAATNSSSASPNSTGTLSWAPPVRLRIAPAKASNAASLTKEWPGMMYAHSRVMKK